jgi:schlafen family protein
VPQRKKTLQRQWRRMDLHLHTPSSADYKQPDISYLDFLRRAEEKNLDIIAFADHNSVSGYARFLEEFESLEMLERLKRLRDDERKRLVEYRRLREKILILPGFEFTATLGFHILGIFPPDTSVRELEHLLLTLRVPADKLDEGSGEVGATVDALTAYRTINDAGGIVIAAHANSSHGIAMVGTDFGGQTRIAYTQDPNLHALEVTDLESRSRRRTATFFNGSKLDYPRRMHCIQGSDAHKLVFDTRYKNEMGLGDRATEILIDEVSFDAIKQVLEGKDYTRTRPARGAGAAAVDISDPLRPMREQGNSLVQAFHERLSDRRGMAHSILEDIAAMANTNGGMIYVGASSNARGAIAGVDRAEAAIGELRAAIAKQITPALDVQIDTMKSQGKTVLRIIVPRGAQTPYTLDAAHIYVRAAGKSNLATREEIVQLVRDSLSVELAATGQTPEVQRVEEAVAEIMPLVDPPHTGVEIATTEVRKGVQYHSVRDLRNRRVVHNVTRMSARHLWQYAVDEYEKNPVDVGKVQWKDDLGIWKAYSHGGKTRYDLVQRTGGKLFVYYGVTEDGLHGPWRNLVGVQPTAPIRVGETLPIADATIIEVSTQQNEEQAPKESMVETEPPEIQALEPTEIIEPAAPAEEPITRAEPMIPTEEPADTHIQSASAIGPEPASEPSVPTPAEAGPPAASTPKTRAQEWREALDRAIAESRVAQDESTAEGKDRSGN